MEPKCGFLHIVLLGLRRLLLLVQKILNLSHSSPLFWTLSASFLVWSQPFCTQVLHCTSEDSKGILGIPGPSGPAFQPTFERISVRKGVSSQRPMTPPKGIVDLSITTLMLCAAPGLVSLSLLLFLLFSSSWFSVMSPWQRRPLLSWSRRWARRFRRRTTALRKFPSSQLFLHPSLALSRVQKGILYDLFLFFWLFQVILTFSPSFLVILSAPPGRWSPPGRSSRWGYTRRCRSPRRRYPFWPTGTPWPGPCWPRFGVDPLSSLESFLCKPSIEVLEPLYQPGSVQQAFLSSTTQSSVHPLLPQLLLTKLKRSAAYAPGVPGRTETSLALVARQGGHAIALEPESHKKTKDLLTWYLILTVETTVNGISMRSDGTTMGFDWTYWTWIDLMGNIPISKISTAQIDVEAHGFGMPTSRLLSVIRMRWSPQWFADGQVIPAARALCPTGTSLYTFS